MDIDEAIKERYSVRKFKREAVPKEKIREVLSVLEHSPTALNFQPVKVFDLRSADAMQKINENCKCIYGAPEVLMLCYDETECWRNPLIRGHKSGITDVSIAADEIMLKAWSMGIGTCFVGLFSDQTLKRVFSLPEEYIPVALMPIGYPSDDCKPRADMHFGTKPLDEMIFEL